MHRYSVDNAVTFTPDDLSLFRASPFAAWMERLTLENPDHGIHPDLNSNVPGGGSQIQQDIVVTLRGEGRDVAVIDVDQPESQRRADTLAAMRDGADFIVNGLLALGTLAGMAHLLMRSSGCSTFGSFLYVPCETGGHNAVDAGFKLSFLADLLSHLQGQLPPQLLMVQADAEVRPLATEDHIHYYLAVKARFLEAMQSFRKHKMPDPSESTHFGRWSDCAAEVMKQRAQSVASQQDLQEDAETAAEEEQYQQVMAAASGAAVAHTAAAAVAASEAGEAAVDGPVLAAPSAETLAEQASHLSADSFRSLEAPGHTPNVARAVTTLALAATDGETVEPDVAPASDGDSLFVATEIGGDADTALSDKEPVEEAAPLPIADVEEIDMEALRVSPPVRADADDAPTPCEPLAYDTDDPLENLEFIRNPALVSAPSSRLADPGFVDRDTEAGRPATGQPEREVPVDVADGTQTPDQDSPQTLRVTITAEQAPPPSLRENLEPDAPWEAEEDEPSVADRVSDINDEPLLLPPDPIGNALEADGREHPLDSRPTGAESGSLVDLDSAPAPGLRPLGAVPTPAEVDLPSDKAPPSSALGTDLDEPTLSQISNRLNTGEDVDEDFDRD